MPEHVDTSDPGKAARVAWAAAVLYARVSGYNADNDWNRVRGNEPDHTSAKYETAIAEAYDVATGKKEFPDV